MDKLLLKPAEAAEILGIARSRTYALIASGELPSVRIGKSVRVPLEALHEWIERLPSSYKASNDGAETRQPSST